MWDLVAFLFGGSAALLGSAYAVQVALNRRERHPQHCAEADGCSPLQIEPLWTEADEKRQALAFIEHPSAFWLDPNLWGDNPGWRDRLLAPPPMTPFELEGIMLNVKLGLMSLDQAHTLVTKEEAPPCPRCKTGRRTVMNVHGGVATMWDCVDCGCEFTRAGETKASRHRRIAARHKQSTLGPVVLRLPCGCPYDTPITLTKAVPHSWSVCKRCHSWWEPPSNDLTGRRLAQGEKVHRSDYDNDLPKPPRTEAIGRIPETPPRPDCPECRHSHPEMHERLWSGSHRTPFYRCTWCQHEWRPNMPPRPIR